MKTLEDVIEEMHDGGFIFNKEISSIIRLACEAMLKETVPKEQQHKGYCKCENQQQHDSILESCDTYNACRADILERAEKFMKRERHDENKK